MTDAEIVALYWERSENAITITKSKYQEYLMKISYNVLANTQDTEECVNDTYLAAWNSMPEQRPSVLATYLGKIVRQISIDKYRKRKSIKRYVSEYAYSFEELDDIFSDGNTPEQILDEKELDDAINRFVRGLPEKERNLFIGRYYFFDSLKQVAGYNGMSEAKAKSILFRTRKKLKEYLRKEGFTV